MDEGTRDLLRTLAAGQKEAVSALVKRLAPVARASVARVLFRHRARARGRDLVQEAEDLTQEALVALFEDGARVLLSYSEDRGASLDTFVRVVSERTALSILRSGKRSPFSEDPTDELELTAQAEPTPSAEARTVSRDTLARLNDRLKLELAPRGYLLFRRLFVDEADVEKVAEEVGMGRDAIYAWKHRFAKSVLRIAAELEQSSDGSEESFP